MKDYFTVDEISAEINVNRNTLYQKARKLGIDTSKIDENAKSLLIDACAETIARKREAKELLNGVEVSKSDLISLESEFVLEIDFGAEFLCPGEFFLLSLFFLVPITFSIIRLYDSFIDLKSFVEFVVLDPIHPVSPEAVIAEYRKVIVAELSQFLSVWLHIIPLLRLILVLRIELSYVHLFAEVVGLPEEYLDLLAPQRCFDRVVGFRPCLHVAAHVVAGDTVVPVEFQRREADVAEAGSYVEYVDLARLFNFDPGNSGVAV